jgi:hypothetical protein
VRPILFLDVDGVLNPEPGSSGRRPAGYQTHRMNPLIDETGLDWVSMHRKPLRVWLNPGHGPALLSLPCDLVWATTWEHQANEWISPHVGLPKLPFVKFDSGTPGSGVHWKTRDLAAYADGRPFVWLDDELNPLRDKRWLQENVTQSFLLIRVDPLQGLLLSHLERVREFATTLDDGRLT